MNAHCFNNTRCPIGIGPACARWSHLCLSASAAFSRVFGHRLGTTNQVRLRFDVVLVPVESRVVHQVIHRKHWLPTKHERVWRNTSDTMWCSVVYQHRTQPACARWSHLCLSASAAFSRESLATDWARQIRSDCDST